MREGLFSIGITQNGVCAGNMGFAPKVHGVVVTGAAGRERLIATGLNGIFITNRYLARHRQK
jgi:hypothetical protein